MTKTSSSLLWTLLLGLVCSFAAPGRAMAQTGPCPDDWTRLFDVDADLYPFASNCFQHPLGTLHDVDEGPRDAENTILFVHGNPNWSFMFHDAMQYMVEQGNRVMSLDQFGFGFSDSLPPDLFGYTPREQSGIFEELVVALDLSNNTTGFLPDFDTETYLSRTTQWGIMASRGLEQLIGGCVVPKGASHAEALSYNATEGAVYDAVFAATIATDQPYLRDVEAGLGNLRDRPYTLIYALGDHIFGEFHADMRDPQNPTCPGDLVAQCGPAILVPGETCETCENIRTNPLNEGWVCRTPAGARIAPYADRFRKILGEETLELYAAPSHERHWGGSHSVTRSLIRTALDTVMEVRA